MRRQTIITWFPVGVVGAALGLALILLLAGCAGQTAVEKARTYGYETSNIYLNLWSEYKATYERSNEEDRAWLTEKIRPLMVKVKAGLITYNDAVLIWSRLAERAEQLGEDPDKYKPDDLENNKIRLNELLYDIINLIAKFRSPVNLEETM